LNDIGNIQPSHWIPTVATSKLDGTRGKLIKSLEGISIINKNGVDYTVRLPEIIRAARELSGNFVMDMEICYFEDGRSLFGGSQRRCSSTTPNTILMNSAMFPVKGMMFDLMELEGKGIEHYPWEKRKALLKQIIKDTPQEAIMYLPHKIEGKSEFFDKVTARGEEGLILKHLGSHYEYRRSPSWVKIKKWDFDRARVVGYTEGGGDRSTTFGSLIMAIPDSRGYLTYRGKVGTGFNHAEIKRIYEILQASETDKQMVTHKNLDSDITWVDTSLEITMKYYEITKDGVARFPSVLKLDEVNQIHFDGSTISGKVKPSSLFSFLNEVKKS